MRRDLLWMAASLALSAALPTYQHVALAQDADASEDVNAEGDAYPIAAPPLDPSSATDRGAPNNQLRVPNANASLDGATLPPPPQFDRRDTRERSLINSETRARNERQSELRGGIQFGRSTDRGLGINQVDRNSIFFQSGIRNGDIIVAVNNRPIRSEDEFMRFIVLHPNQRVPVIVLRDGRRQTIYFEYPQEVVQAQHIDEMLPAPSGGVYLGVVFDDQIRDAAVLQKVNPGSPAEVAGLQAGDIILAMNGQEVRSYPDAISMIRSMRPNEELQIVIERARNERQMVAVLDAPLNVHAATQPSDVRIEQQRTVEPRVDGQVDENRRDSSGRFNVRGRNRFDENDDDDDDDNRGRRLRLRFRN